MAPLFRSTPAPSTPPHTSSLPLPTAKAGLERAPSSLGAAAMGNQRATHSSPRHMWSPVQLSSQELGAIDVLAPALPASPPPPSGMAFAPPAPAFGAPELPAVPWLPEPPP